MNEANTTLKSLTEEEKRERIARFLGQKREAFATGILFNLCSRCGARVLQGGNVELVDRAVEMADHLLEKLYPVTTESKEA